MSAQGGEWVDRVLRPALVAAMLACLAAPLLTLLQLLLPGWRGGYFLVFCFVANLEGILSERLLRAQRITGWAYLASRAAEFLVLWLALKLAGYLPLGWDALRADALRWAADPGSFLTVADLNLSLPFLVLWIGAIYMARLLVDLDVVHDQPPADRTSTAYYLWLTQPALTRDRHQTLDRLGELYLAGGGLLLGSLTLIRLAFGPVPLPVAVCLAYFALGIVLLGQGQFGALQAAWHVQRIDVQSNIGRRWLVWALLFLVLVTVVAFLLPTTYSLDPLRALLGVVLFLLNIILFVFSLAVYLLALLLSLIFPMMNVPSPPVLRPPAAPTAPGAPPAGQNWLQVILSALFWLIVAGIVVYAFVRVARERLAAAGEESWWRRLLAWLRGLGLGLRAWQRLVQAGLPRRPRALPGVDAGGLFSLPRRLPPREMIRYFYLSTVRRAGRAGRSRRPAQTPLEYRADLDATFPELEPDLERLTDAFIRARYAPHPVEPAHVAAARPLWQRIKDALQRRIARPPAQE